MKTSTLTLLAFAASGLAFPDPGGHEFRAPGPFDSV